MVSINVRVGGSHRDIHDGQRIDISNIDRVGGRKDGNKGGHTVGGSCRRTTSGRGARNSMSHSIAMACSTGFSSSSSARGSRDIQRGLQAGDTSGQHECDGMALPSPCVADCQWRGPPCTAEAYLSQGLTCLVCHAYGCEGGC